MVLIIREDMDNINSPPEEMKTCDSFIWDVQDFMEAVQEQGGGASFVVPRILMSSFLLVLGMLF